MAVNDEAPAGPSFSGDRLGTTVSVCLAGHLVPGAGGDGAAAGRLCPQCGAAVIGACPGCREPVLGVPVPAPPSAGLAGTAPEVEGLLAPRYCHCCGRPFPWTERVVSAVRMAIRELRSLDAFERDQLRRSVDHIIHETPQTRLAVIRINATLARVGGETGERVRQLLIAVASEGVRKLLGAAPAGPGET